ncbi:MAG: hypothetical protein N2662_09470 [Bacteroidales bacterium]|nr:hypothetical protein [Bacteroidales bacterium]
MNFQALKNNRYLTNLPIIFLSMLSLAFAADNPITSDCKCEGITLYGRVQFVDNFADFKIKFVENFPDIKVKFVDYKPSKCGEWQVVTTFPDFKVKIVDQFPDFKVRIVDSFPGIK